ncbi:hypothetical protein SARC_09037 [Sphaeroforma arctica JP610]|uniref:Enoyl reductase (ER) domain-containing protein n=1 Tax=Sphaeroforma arctica JP610 TaxID=667725 RepID=A0A0L0FRA6_9EUKA|nr:hypothetical protein SARC_09037 [Sphaeroforma arctica JP610]KNC78533.1 hypothetical protein SARC_09037 [Sphaeroforma arctica JP610]|eukprot:XP_014152435.1 hypothetical protein SARC_09037 [Sphaeroforma arctica JP610]
MSATKLETPVTAVGIAVKGNPTKDGKFEETEYTIEELNPGQVLVKITATSICHTDFQCFNTDGAVPGHEMCGKIEAMADDVKDLKIGQRVAIGWQRSSCRDCEFCNKGEENMCQKKTNFQDGKAGWATYVVWDAHFVAPVPDSIEDSAVAPLMCAGTTVYNAFKQNGVKKGDKVAIVSIGGLGHLGLMIAHKMGCEVTAISRGMDKKEEAEGFGANKYIDSKNKDHVKAAEKEFDFMLITTPADLDCDMYASMIQPQHGVMCFVGVPPSFKFTFGIYPIIVDNIKITGSLIASPETTNEMLKFCADNDVQPTIERFEFNADAFLKAVKRVNDNEIRFRAVMLL